MTNNELMTMQESTFSYDFKPAEIEFKDYETLLSVAEEMAIFYDNLVLENATLADINERHLELNSQIKALEKGRLNVKRKYNEPLDNFEKKVKKIVNTLESPLQDIKDARDKILEAQEEVRREALIDYLERQIKESKVRLEDIKIENSWTNKGNWTEKLNPRKPLVDEIKRNIEDIEEEFRRQIAEREVLETFLDEKGLEHAGWVTQLRDKEALEIIQEIQRAEADRLKKEQAERELAEKITEKNDKENERETFVSTEKNEIAGSFERTMDGIAKTFQEAKEKQNQPELFTERIEVTGTLEQLEELSKFLNNNEIKYEPVPKPIYTKDDLPF